MQNPATSILHGSRRSALAVALAIAFAGAGLAQAAPPGMRGAAPVPSAEALATVPSLSATQQVELRKILIDARDAHESVRSRSREAFKAQLDKDRAENERIDNQNSERVRKLLGDDGYRLYAQWQLDQRHRSHHGDRHGDRRGDGPGFHRAGPHGAHGMGDGKHDGRPGPAAIPQDTPAPGAMPPVADPDGNRR